MGVEFFSDFTTSIQLLQAQMTILLNQEFKHQPQLKAVRVPQIGRPKHILKTEGRGKKCLK